MSSSQIENQLKTYLDPFYPSKNLPSPIKENVLTYFGEQLKDWDKPYYKLPNPVLKVLAKDLDELNTIISYYILSFSKWVHWNAIGTYELIEKYFGGDRLYEDILESPVLILYHGNKIIENKLIGENTQALLEFRAMHHSPALFISCNKGDGYSRKIKEFETVFVEYFKDVDFKTFSSGKESSTRGNK